MKNIRKELSVWLQLGTFIAIWVAILFVSKTDLAINWEAVKKLPDVVTVYAILYFVFSRWLWRLPVFQGWLVPYPDLQGTWEGMLQTTWVDPKTGKVPAPIPLLLVIKQSFDSISCVMHTQESSSVSNAAQISEDDGSGIYCLSYNYTNKPDAALRGRSAIHDGAALLTVVRKPKKILKGEYWTNRKSTGSIELNYKSKELVENFPDRLKSSKRGKP